MKPAAIIIAKGRGKTWRRSLAAAERRVQEGELYLIRRGGYWFRKGAHGYTDDLADAGMFVGKDARGYLNAEGVSLVLLISIQAQVQKAAAEARERWQRLAGMIAA